MNRIRELFARKMKKLEKQFLYRVSAVTEMAMQHAPKKEVRRQYCLMRVLDFKIRLYYRVARLLPGIITKG